MPNSERDRRGMANQYLLRSNSFGESMVPNMGIRKPVSKLGSLKIGFLWGRLLNVTGGPFEECFYRPRGPTATQIS